MGCKHIVTVTVRRRGLVPIAYHPRIYAQGRVKKSDDPSFVSYRDNYVYFALVYWVIIFTFAVVALERGLLVDS